MSISMSQTGIHKTIDIRYYRYTLMLSGHTSHSELVSFLQRSKASLRDESSLIIVKENTCEDGPDGSPKEFLDEEDSSLTR
jgi:hypothetical protein